MPDAPTPADDEAGRLRQMRDLARRFSAREFWDGRTYALRLLPHPIDRYADPASGLVDGTIFTFANGTNPELLLLIEARRHGDGPAKWSYAAARFARSELFLKLGPRCSWTGSAHRQGSRHPEPGGAVLHHAGAQEPARRPPSAPHTAVSRTYYTTLTPRRRSGR